MNPESGNPKNVAQWKIVLALLLANRTAGDHAVLATLGDELSMLDYPSASQICYLLAGILPDGPQSKYHLFSANNISNPIYYKNIKAIRLTELFEAIHTQKSNSPGLAHLQAYKLWLVSLLSDCGLVNESLTYLESINDIGKSFNDSSAALSPDLVGQLTQFHDRLVVSHNKKEFLNKNDSSGWFRNFTGAALGRGIESLMNSAVGVDDEKQKEKPSGSPSSLYPVPSDYSMSPVQVPQIINYNPSPLTLPVPTHSVHQTPVSIGAPVNAMNSIVSYSGNHTIPQKTVPFNAPITNNAPTILNGTHTNPITNGSVANPLVALPKSAQEYPMVLKETPSDLKPNFYPTPELVSQSQTNTLGVSGNENTFNPPPFEKSQFYPSTPSLDFNNATIQEPVAQHSHQSDPQLTKSSLQNESVQEDDLGLGNSKLKAKAASSADTKTSNASVKSEGGGLQQSMPI